MPTVGTKVERQGWGWVSFFGWQDIPGVTKTADYSGWNSEKEATRSVVNITE
jgi:hypothetical protein